MKVPPVDTEDPFGRRRRIYTSDYSRGAGRDVLFIVDEDRVYGHGTGAQVWRCVGDIRNTAWGFGRYRTWEDACDVAEFLAGKESMD